MFSIIRLIYNSGEDFVQSFLNQSIRQVVATSNIGNSSKKKKKKN